jgi:hypothetical protein
VVMVKVTAERGGYVVDGGGGWMRWGKRSADRWKVSLQEGIGAVILAVTAHVRETRIFQKIRKKNFPLNPYFTTKWYVTSNGTHYGLSMSICNQKLTTRVALELKPSREHRK